MAGSFMKDSLNKRGNFSSNLMKNTLDKWGESIVTFACNFPKRKGGGR